VRTAVFVERRAFPREPALSEAEGSKPLNARPRREQHPNSRSPQFSFVILCVLRGSRSMSIAANIRQIQERIAAAGRRAGRSPEDITLMAVSKTFPPESIREAYAAGLRIFGENRVQEFAGKVEAVRDLRDAEWHLIGHLQTNKAAKAAELFNAVNSVDSVRLAEKLNAAAESLGKTLAVLIEINVGGEEAKSGVAPDSSELELILQAAPRFNNLTIRGLMTVPPYTEDPKAARPYFQELRTIRDRIAARKLPLISTEHLSMGMSHDFEIAIEEGSTCVRVGTAIFGTRASA
jgi:pyridoxal phosphate enzyme (YggS family)